MTERYVTRAQMIARLSQPQRDMLISHIDGPVVYDRRQDWTARGALVARGLIKPDNPHAERPRYTVITEEGRHALAVVLAEYADALVRAGLLDGPIEALRRLKELVKPGRRPPGDADLPGRMAQKSEL